MYLLRRFLSFFFKGRFLGMSCVLNVLFKIYLFGYIYILLAQNPWAISYFALMMLGLCSLSSYNNSND